VQKIKSHFKSFSFRTGVLIFLGLCTTMLTLRVLVYYQSISDNYEQVRLLVEAHADEINQDMEGAGIKFVENTIDAILDDADDLNLYIGLSDENGITGNFPDWAQVSHVAAKETRAKSFHHLIGSGKDGKPVNLYAEMIRYPQNTILIVAYNLKEVDAIRHSFFKVLLENILLAFLISFAISLAIVWLMNRQFRKLNDACGRVISGDLDFRIQVNDSHDQFNLLAQNFNSVLDWNNALISTVKDSTNAIAHDMRTPLSRLRIRLSGISQKKGVDDTVKQEVKECVVMVDKLVEMFDNILKISRAESRSSTDQFEHIDFKVLLNDIIEFYDAVVEEKNLVLEKDIEWSDTIPFRGDKQLLSQAIVNLLDNACKYTHRGGSITISLQVVDACIYLTIADTGIGIDGALLDKVSERFFRVDGSRHEEGYGLGLSLVKAVAALHHGRLILEQNNPGLRASLIFPIKTFA
jgi:signal transduction histidine kinase